MRWYGILSALAACWLPANAIFIDDAFHIDFHHALLGVPQSHTTLFHKSQASSNASLLYTISDKAVLGAINPKDGNVLWRQSLAGQPLDNPSSSFLVARERDGQIITGHDRTVASWDALDGRLVWTYLLPEGTSIQDLHSVVKTDSTSSAVEDVIVLAVPHSEDGQTRVARVAGNGSGLKWEHLDKTASPSAVSLAISPQHVYLVTKSDGLITGGKAKVVTFDVGTGKEIGSTTIAVDVEPLGENGQYTAGSKSAYPFLVSTEKPYKTVKVSPLKTSKVETLAIESKGEEIESISVICPSSTTDISHFVLHIKGTTRQWADVYHIDSKTGSVNKAYSLPATEENSILSVSGSESTLYLTRSTESELKLYSTSSHGELARWQRTGPRSTFSGQFPSHGATEVVSRGKDLFAVRIAEASSSGDWSLIRNGELQWSRPEYLAYAEIAAWSENPRPDALAEELEVEASVNPLTAYAHRLKRHASDLTNLPAYLQDLPHIIFKTDPNAIASTRQSLVGSKMVVLGTSRKELIALDATNSGTLYWQTDLSLYITGDTVIKSLVVDNGHTTVYLSDGSLVVVDTATGKVIEYLAGSIPVSRLIHLPGHPAPAVVKISADGTPRLADDFAPSNPEEGSIVVTLTADGSAVGWSVGQSVEKTWTLSPKPGFKFISAFSRPQHDPIASVGKVLGNRAVLYKHISPNIALLVASSPSAIAVYIVNGVTGTVLHTSIHQGILPGTEIPALVSENWAAYSFTSQDPITKALSTQIVISELYESASSNDRGPLGAKSNFSSFSADAGALPHVISQAYTVAEPISSLAVTQTAQGITSRQLLAVLSRSNSIVGIPREILDARRPVDRDANSTEREEGLMRYTPNLEFEPRHFLNHAREVIGIKKVITTPSLLESTSVVFAFGHDIFGTQVAPSQTFDVLGKGFNKVSLILTVVSLGAGVFAVRPFVKKKTVEGRWR
ncbi:hypothetical protein B0A52_03375 [Exophiala mesophila]|uniref:ER membrane protein complex subunit 1 n=1 Tax=Exophiala mesophila TaxID=212818 RepID=A0A438N5L9_EXOME|nr:hypothetical protein B0A52_03375 [Exophiala mesophila]